MNQHRFDPAAQPPLFDISWERDFETRLEPRAFTALLREQVPVLEYVDWSVTDIEPGVAKSLLPLNVPSTNQHFTHQAALLVLAADYTGGVALTSLLTGWPILGVHPVPSRYSVSMWLLKVEIKYLRPSVADLTVSARIDAADHNRIRRRFLDGKAVVETITIEFKNGDLPVAEATATYYARQSDKLRTVGISTERVNTLYQLKLTSSAELIAGVRARESGGLFSDPFAQNMAGQHGMALATRFCERTPQLGGMVAARTRHLDDTLLNFTAAGGRQIVNVGVGWCMRPFRLNLPAGTRFYELDFPTTLDERRKRLADYQVTEQPGVERFEVPIDVRSMPLAEVLAAQLNLDEPVLVVWEGVSMYLLEDEVREVLAGMQPILANPESLLWLDLVDHEPIAHPERFPAAVQNFMRGMQILGEPFTFGTDTAEEFVSSAGLRCMEVVTSDAYFPQHDDSVYQFCVAGGKNSKRGPRTFKATRFDAPAKTPTAPHFATDQRLDSRTSSLQLPIEQESSPLEPL